jgi:hypothetical protein
MGTGKAFLRARTTVWVLGALVGACRGGENGDEQGAAPPPIVAPKPGVCTSGGGESGDKPTSAYFPRVSGDYCLDPNGETRAYGEDAKGTLDEVCTQQFDGECEVYKSYGLERVVTLRYVDGKGSPGAVAVTLSRYASNEGGYGFFTKRIVADGDPREVAPEPLEAGAVGALGSGIAYVFRGEYVAELSYTNEVESPDQMRESSRRVLPALAKAIGERLPGEPALPAAAQALPADHRIPMGIRYEYQDVLDVAGLGRGAVGYYKDGEKRFRVFVLVRSDEDAAKDVLSTLKKLDGAKVLKDAPVPALSVPRQRTDTSPRVQWVIARHGSRVFGIGDEELVLGADQPPDKRAKVELTEDEKLARLKSLVSAGG